MSDEQLDAKCEAAGPAALQKWMEMCGREQAIEAAKPMVGLERGTDIDCSITLAGGPESLENPREWVLCRWMRLWQSEGMDIIPAKQRAWDEYDEKMAAAPSESDETTEVEQGPGHPEDEELPDDEPELPDEDELFEEDPDDNLEDSLDEVDGDDVVIPEPQGVESLEELDAEGEVEIDDEELDEPLEDPDLSPEGDGETSLDDIEETAESVDEALEGDD